MNEKNIWENLNLTEDNLKTAFDYLKPQSENFSAATKSELLMEVEVSRTEAVDETKRRMTLYSLSIIAPNLGNFRKKLFHVAEFDDTGRFPVNIFCHIDNSLKRDVAEMDFLSVVKEILSRPSVVGSIEGLYRQSLSQKKKI